MQDIKTIIFDFDETIYLGNVWTKWGEHLKLAFMSFLKDKNKVEEIYEKYNLTNASSTRDAIIACEKEHLPTKKYYKFFRKNIYQHSSKDVKILPNEFFKELAKKYHLYIVSMSNKEYLKYYFKHYHIDKKNFKEIYSVDLFDDEKGKSKIFKKIQKKEKVNFDEMLMIGDNLATDVMPALELGMQSLHFKKDFNQLYDFFTKENILDCERYKT